MKKILIDELQVKRLKLKYCGDCLDRWIKCLQEDAVINGTHLLTPREFNEFCDKCKGNKSLLDAFIMNDLVIVGAFFESLQSRS